MITETATRAETRPRVRLPDTATTAVLVDELLATDGPHADYADHWLKVGGMHALVTFPPATPATNAA
jgi:hypothetical protein